MLSLNNIIILKNGKAVSKTLIALIILYFDCFKTFGIVVKLYNLWAMKSANNESILGNRLKVLHVLAPLIAPACTGDIPQGDTDQHESQVTVKKLAYYADVPTNISAQLLK